MICSLDGCEKNVVARGWCQRHYDSWRYHGDPSTAARGPRGEAVRWIKQHVDYVGLGCLTWPFHRRKTGYAATVWPEGVEGPQVLATRLMCELAHGMAPSSKHEAAHNCGNGHLGCVHPMHLRWATRQENVDDKRAHGTVPIGEKNPSAKLTVERVKLIRRSKSTLQNLADKLGVSKATVGDARTRKTWGHVR